MDKSIDELKDSYNAYQRSADEALKETSGPLELDSYTTAALEGKHDWSVFFDLIHLIILGVIDPSNVQKLLSEAKVALADLRDKLSECKLSFLVLGTIWLNFSS